MDLGATSMDLGATSAGVWVAFPVVAAVAVGVLLLPAAQTFAAVLAVAVLMAVGNGLGSGIVMTMGADTAPTVGRAQYLGGWRLVGDIGGTSAPLLVGLLVGPAVPRRRLRRGGRHRSGRHRLGDLVGPRPRPFAAPGIRRLALESRHDR